ncbi:M56 family metallopeptidase [Aliikangiella sp. G2MR2-5]|uniref:M56 family metallopeptidase n=1 Tax=Aliikangiella sp. G2MR2-5 TaxID=2788943 RepID=UPI0018A983D7
MIEQLLALSRPTIEFLWLNSLYAGVLALFVLAIKCFYPRLSKNIEYGLWCLVLIRLVLPNHLAFSYAISGNLREWVVGSLISYPFNDFVIPTQDPLSVSSIFSADDLTFGLLFVFWAGTVSVVLLRYLAIRFSLLRLINRASPVVAYPIVSCANRWRLNFWIRQPVHVIAEDKYFSPFTFFFKSPVIFIPRAILTNAEEKTIESIIAHEMAHVKRKDSFWLLIQNIIQIVFFFNPLVWFIVRRLSNLRERICDEMVLSTNEIEPQVYGESLLSVLRFNINGEFTVKLSNAFLGYKGQIKQRIVAIGMYTSKTQRPLMSRVGLLLVSCFFLPFLNQAPVSPTDKQVVKKLDPDSPFPEHIREQVRLPVVHREHEE